MTYVSTDRRVEEQTPPTDPALLATARQSPGGWAYEVDWTYPADQRTPPEAIRGGWAVGDDGILTGVFAPNPRYRPIERCERQLKPYVHAAARTHRAQWIVEIDPRGEDRFPDVPEAMIRGWWYVDGDGRVTDRFRSNSRWIDHDAEQPR